MKPYLPSMLVIGFLAGCANQPDPNAAFQERSKLAMKHLAEITPQKNADPKKWGMTHTEVWRIHELDYYFTSPTGFADAQTGKIIIPTWCEGKDANNQHVKKQIRIQLNLSGLQGIEYEILEERPLTFWHQAVAWVAYAYGTPVLLLGIGLMFGLLNILEIINPIVFLSILFVFVLCSAGVAAYYCFASGWAVLVAVPVSLVVNLVIMGTLIDPEKSTAADSPNPLFYVMLAVFTVVNIIGIFVLINNTIPVIVMCILVLFTVLFAGNWVWEKLFSKRT
jgi:hypothetical protein